MKVVYLYLKDRRPQTPVKGAFDSSIVVEALKKVFPYCRRYRGVVHIADEYYYPVSMDDIEHVKDIASKHGIPVPSSRDYRSVVWDCDDYSFLWKGLFQLYGYMMNVNYCFGVVWVYSRVKFYGHALNFYVDCDGCFRFFEPQTLEVFSDRRDDWYLIEVKV